MTEPLQSDAATTFWRAFYTAWRESGAESAGKICQRLRDEHRYTLLSESTLRGWLDDTKTALPRKDEQLEEMLLMLVGKDRAADVMRKLYAARQQPSATRQNSADIPDGETPPPTPPTPTNLPPEAALNSFPRRWIWLAAAIAFGSALTLVSFLVFNQATSPEAGTRPIQPDSSDAAAGDPSAASCTNPKLRVPSRAEGARAEFCPESRVFLLYDTESDGASAILVIRRNGDELPAYFNTKKHATRGADGQLHVVPPMDIRAPVNDGDEAELRVCVGENNREKSYPLESCSDWTPFWPAK